MRRHQFEAYLDKVFDFSDRVAALPEGRLYPQHCWKKVFQAVFLGAACQFGNLHRLEAECHQGVFRKRIGPLSEDAIGYTLQRQQPKPVFDLGCEMARQLKRNGVLRSQWARGRVVAAADGIEICSSFIRCCEGCLERRVTHKVQDEIREDIQFYHRISAVAVVSGAFPIPLGIRFQQAGETEVSCTLALLQELREKLGRRFFDVLVADALYLQKPFVEALEALGLDWVINLKDNQPELSTEAERVTDRQPDSTESAPHQQLQLWHAPEVYWPVADRSIAVVKTVRIQTKNRTTVVRLQGHPKRHRKQVYAEQSTNFYASNLELGSIPPTFIHQLGRSRWSIDADVFQTLTTNSHLKRPSVHQDRGQALVVLTMIRILAYTLMLVFYHRQVQSHFRKSSFGLCDLARRMTYLFLAPRLESS